RRVEEPDPSPRERDPLRRDDGALLQVHHRLAVGHVGVPPGHLEARRPAQRRHGALGGDQDPRVHASRSQLPRDADLLRRADRRVEAEPLARRLREPVLPGQDAVAARPPPPRRGRHAAARRRGGDDTGARRAALTMALCFAHTAAGYLAYEAVRPASAHRPGLLAAAVLLANGPDLDFVPGVLLWHTAGRRRRSEST